MLLGRAFDFFHEKKGYEFIRMNKMKFNSLERKNVVSLALLFILIFTSLLSVGCGKKPEEKPQPNPPEEKRICSFSVSNLNSLFSLDTVSITVRYGINSTNLENYKAAFLASDNSGKAPSVLQSIEGLDKDDYSFAVSDGNYDYKKEATLHFENSFFDKTSGEFSLSLCLFDKADNTMEIPIVGYQYAVEYKISDGKIAFEIKSESVIRHH